MLMAGGFWHDNHQFLAQVPGRRMAQPMRTAIWVWIDVVTSYQPMSLAALARHLVAALDDKFRWKLVWEFLEEYRWEPAETQVHLVQAEPDSVGDERWDALLAALAEHLCAQHDLAAPEWAEPRVLQRAWFPAELAIQRADALVWAPAAFRKHGVYLSVHDLAAA
jgi:hypothetical protein